MTSNQLRQTPNEEPPSTAPLEEKQNTDTEELQIQQTLTQQGNPQWSKEEQEKWRANNKKEPKKSWAEQTTAKHNRLARISSKRVISNPPPAPSSEMTIANSLSTDLGPEQEDTDVWNINTTPPNDNIGAKQNY
jgi:hypothetical protein